MALFTRGACSSRSALYSESGTIHMSTRKEYGGVKTSGCKAEVDTSSNGGGLERCASCNEDGFCDLVDLSALGKLEGTDSWSGVSFSIEAPAAVSCMMARMS